MELIESYGFGTVSTLSSGSVNSEINRKCQSNLGSRILVTDYQQTIQISNSYSISSYTISSFHTRIRFYRRNNRDFASRLLSDSFLSILTIQVTIVGQFGLVNHSNLAFVPRFRKLNNIHHKQDKINSNEHENRTSN